MAESVPVPSRGGRLSYLPESPDYSSASASPSGPFRPRRSRLGRIEIARVPDYIPSRPKTNPKRARITSKLAGSRDHAKRFFRSVVATHSSAAPSSASTTTATSSSSSSDSTSSSAASGTRRSSSASTSTTSSRNPFSTSEGGPSTSVAGAMRTGARSSISGPISGLVSRPALAETVRTASGRSNVSSTSTALASAAAEEKPLASGNGITVGIALAEPVLFLQGFEQQDRASGSTAMLRGSLRLKVAKSAKIKAVTLKFKGRAMTKWPEGIPPRKVEFEEIDTIMSHTWPFFNAQFPTAEGGSCADHVELANGPSPTSSTPSMPNGLGFASPNSSTTDLDAREHKRLSLQVNQSRSFGKGEMSSGGPSVAQKGYRTFQPGDYVYNFELPLDSRLPETIDVELGSVRYELEAVVERAGAFRANLVGNKEVHLIRAPAEGSLEQVEPIAISRNWEDQLHYDIVISGKSFPLGGQIPIAFKLTPLAKVQCHRIKVLATESIEYFCSRQRVHRTEPTRKVQLFEKRADGPSISAFPGSSVRVTAGGGIPYDSRSRAAAGEEVTPQDTTNLLGNLDGQYDVGPTEMELNVQLPSCQSMKERDKAQRLHFDTTYQNIQVHHWIKVVMRLSKPDQNDPVKRRHFEISIDSPFHILSCRATQANTALPAYSSPESVSSGTHLYECGCPGAPRRRNSPTSFVPTLNVLNNAREARNSLSVPSPTLARPQQAHIGGPNSNNVQRPIHMLRAPSFNPPAFEDEQPPPPLITPPPQYDSIASPTNGLADYFSRFSDAYDEDSGDEGTMRGNHRVDMPLTPGSRVNRSMDVQRTWLPVGHYTQ
ncbi:hypothetical protein LTR16_002046 [Cryomyces antarcticus]|uniref:Arrestin C-terminal-like domain-containing protein n=1 Tax=Cryomyces antarcticus TaxID=329879 RepID=A0ABR0M886_9PEZI|nr:hypothetical protein LTR16_002046 [Cryomyces antarcticus]